MYLVTCVSQHHNAEHKLNRKFILSYIKSFAAADLRLLKKNLLVYTSKKKFKTQHGYTQVTIPPMPHCMTHNVLCAKA